MDPTPSTSKQVNQLVHTWLECDPDFQMWDAVSEEPEIAWKTILQILKNDLADEKLSLLAAGPMEDLLVKHGESFIDRIEQEARENSNFNHLLGGVWPKRIPAHIWERVAKVRKIQW